MLLLLALPWRRTESRPISVHETPLTGSPRGLWCPQDRSRERL